MSFTIFLPAIILVGVVAIVYVIDKYKANRWQNSNMI